MVFSHIQNKLQAYPLNIHKKRSYELSHSRLLLDKALRRSPPRVDLYRHASNCRLGKAERALSEIINPKAELEKLANLNESDEFFVGDGNNSSDDVPSDDSTNLRLYIPIENKAFIKFAFEQPAIFPAVTSSHNIITLPSLILCLLVIYHRNIIVYSSDDGIVVNNNQCVLEDNCENSTNNNGFSNIDLRSSRNVCPVGQVQCSISEITCGQRRIRNYIGNNGQATLGAHPWQAFITLFGSYIGSGTLMDKKHVLTTAHKVLGVNQNQLRVVMGVWDPNNRNNQTRSYTVTNIYINNAFSNDTFKHNIAILLLSQEVTPNIIIGPACLPISNNIYTHQTCIVAGWGDSSFVANDRGTTTQRQVNIRIVDDATCRRSMIQQNVDVEKHLDRLGQICAGGESSLDACTQDGGSPLICFDPPTNKYTIVGIVIRGRRCGQEGVYGVYTNVAYYRNWIDNALQTL
ncbi:tryptase-related [Holotrichia oblita]|uniref:Tryptase-related n=1 Tax=Holotrichia oblita TaxID=644536 RepID=A0ACB9T6D7_HOLOL|nr:tryptase-related [Holotrichia oblita]